MHASAYHSRNSVSGSNYRRADAISWTNNRLGHGMVVYGADKLDCCAMPAVMLTNSDSHRA